MFCACYFRDKYNMTDKQLKKENFFLRRQEGTLYMFSYTIGLCLL